MMSKRFYGPALLGAVLAIPVFTGCGDDANNPLCCNEFKVGATIDANIGGSAESKVAVQAVADISGIASAAIDDLTTACRGIATDLDATTDEVDAANAKTSRSDRLKAFCELAVGKITAFKAKASFTIAAQAPKCEASFSAKANCQASCSGGAKCDVKATPPTCEGGKLEVACKGECKAKAGAKLSCEGSCGATCTGSCTAQGGVQCNGKCEGTCEGNTADGSAKGECQGTCKGTCAVTAPNVKCEGSCKGECGGSCTGSANASVTCDGECSVDAEPLKCTGGELKGGCKVEAKCDANCNASVSAKAECTPPSIGIVFAANADAAAAGKLEAALKGNLGVVLAFKSRLSGILSATGTFTANVGAVVDIKAACIPPVVAAVGTALADVKASADATVSLAGAVGAS